MRKVKLGFVGAGFMGQTAHMFNYDALQKECQIVALAEPRPQLRQKVAAKYGIPAVYDDHEQLLQHKGVDAIIASQPYQRHRMLIPDILKANIPVFTEKPLTLGVEAGEELVKLGEELGVLHMVGYHKRSDPAMEYARKLMDEWNETGEFGTLRYVRVTMPPGNWTDGIDMPIGSDEPPVTGELEPKPKGFTEKELQDYDWFVNYYIHQVNAIRFILGESYHLTFCSRSGLLLVGESDSGITVSLEMAIYFTSIEWHETILIAYQNAYIKIDLPAPLARQRAGKVTVMRDSEGGIATTTEPVMPLMSAMRKQAINFLAAVRGEQPAPCVAREAVEDLKIARDFIMFMAAYKDK